MILKGFILSIESFGENDLNLIFFSEEEGKIKILVKGARKLKAKLRGLCQFFIFLELKIVKGKRNIHLIGGRELKVFKNIIESFKKIEETSFLLSTLNSFFPFLKKDHKIFVLTLKTLEKINDLKEEKSEIISSAFLIKLLAFLGFKPEIRKCLACHQDLSKFNHLIFNFKEGGVVCPTCAKASTSALWASADKSAGVKISFAKPRSELCSITGDLSKILQDLLYKDYKFLETKDFKSRESLIKTKNIIKEFLQWRQ